MYLRFQSEFLTPDYEIQANGTGGCGPYASAWSYPCVHATNIKLCTPNYFEDSDPDDNVSLEKEQWKTAIHEMAHLYYCAADWAYDWNNEFHKLSTLQKLTNADHFAEFVANLCP